jgi:hypothetical protein
MLLGVAAAETLACQSARGDGPIELMDSVRVAFYERAPGNVAASMRAAVLRECESRKNRDMVERKLCRGGPLSFLRGVDVLGNLQQTGFVCNANGLTRGMRYFLQDMLVNNRDCIFVFFNAKTKEHFLDGEEMP